jgi:isopentenyl phosphate kinase
VPGARAGPVIVKLGGSVITRKRGPARLRPKLLARLAEEMAAAPAGGAVLLHGAGSFGHPGALRFHLAEPPSSTSLGERRRGAAIVSAEVRRLHQAVLTALLRAGCPAWSVPTSIVAENREGRPFRYEVAAARAAAAQGLLPVGFGDVVPDAAWGFSILSADSIAVALARELESPRVLFVSDVDGILREPPGAPGRPTIFERVDRSVVEGLLPHPGAPDVTGGIRGKARALLELADMGAEAAIISGLKRGALSRALRGEHVYGSWSGPAPG